jgi:hypothetical protein
MEPFRKNPSFFSMYTDFSLLQAEFAFSRHASFCGFKLRVRDYAIVIALVILE